MGKWFLPLAMLVSLALGCSSEVGPSPPPPPPVPPPAPPANTVNVTSNVFTPVDLSVSRNITVTWSFQGGTHNVTFEDNQNNSSDLSSGTHQRQFTTTGTFRYRCTLHSSGFASGAGMIGQISVAN